MRGSSTEPVALMSYAVVKKDDPQWAFYSVTEWGFLGDDAWDKRVRDRDQHKRFTLICVCFFFFTLKLQTGHSRGIHAFSITSF